MYGTVFGKIKIMYYKFLFSSLLVLVTIFSFAANLTISADVFISALDRSGLNAKDTVFVNAQLRIDQDDNGFESIDSLVIIVGNEGAIHYRANDNHSLTLDSSVSLSFVGTGTITWGGQSCNNNQKRISLNSKSYAACTEDLSNGIISFTQLVDDGGIATSGVALPVTLGFFKGYISGDFVILNWKTFMEYNSSHYEIEKLSNQEWSQIGNILSQNEINGADYEFTISLTEKKFDQFFRLKMVDFDGSYEYSPVVKVSPTFSNQIDWVIFPNPVNDLMNIQVKDDIQFVEILDAFGNIVLSETTSTVNLRNLSQGFYFVRIRTESGHLLTQKILKN